MGIHLDFYNHCMKTGVLPVSGLCGCVDKQMIDESLLNLFIPTHDDMKELINKKQMLYFTPNGYWGAGTRMDDPDTNRAIDFTPLRQTIVLLMAAMNNEL